MKKESFILRGEAVAAIPYRYRACGLDGIYLLNGYRIEEHDGEQHVAVSDVDGLHKAIGRHLVLHRKALAPKEIRFLRNTMDLTQAELAKKLGNNSQSVARWEKGTCEIPGPSEKILRAVFFANVMTGTNEDAEILRQMLISTLADLDMLDEVVAPDAQFELFDHWSEKLDKHAA